MSKKRLSGEDKRRVILSIYQDLQEPLNLKEIEQKASKAGVVQQTIKEMNQSLVDDSLVQTDKIGSANFFWSFPASNFISKTVGKDLLTRAVQNKLGEIENINTEISASKKLRCSEGRDAKLEELNCLRDEEKIIDEKIESLKDNDPEYINSLSLQRDINQRESNRWTDNIWTLKSYLVKKRSMSGKEVDKIIGFSNK